VSEKYEYARADKIAVGDRLPFTHQSKGQGVRHWFPVVKVEPKRKLIWLTVEDPTTGERWTTREYPGTEMAYRDEGALIAEQEEQP
jgi:hypothetical protein